MASLGFGVMLSFIDFLCCVRVNLEGGSFHCQLAAPGKTLTMVSGRRTCREVEVEV